MIDFQQTVESHPWVILLIAAAVWFGAQWALAYVVLPYRNELRSKIGLAKNAQLNAQENEILDHLWATAFAARSTILLSATYLLALLTPRDALMREHEDLAAAHPNLWVSPTMDRIIDCHFISIFAANPLFGIVALALKWAWRLKIIVVKRSFTDNSHYSLMPELEATCRA